MKLPYEEPVLIVTDFDLEIVGASGGIELPDHNW